MLQEIFETTPEDGEGTISLTKVETSEHRGDLFTKGLDAPKFRAALTMIQMT